MAEASAGHALAEVALDEVSLAPASPEQEHERRVAVTDLLKSNVFQPAGGKGGPYALRIGLVEDRLALDISGPDFEVRHILSLSPFRRIVRDYLTVCHSYRDAMKAAGPAQIEAIDMGRRGLHNEGAALLIERLDGKVQIDPPTARRLFTLLCALHWRG